METQLIEALPRMGDAANHPELKQAIQKPSGGDALSSAPAGRDPAALRNRALEHVAHDGPQPPKGHPNYHFRLSALDMPRLELGGAPRPKLRVRTFWPKLQDREYAKWAALARTASRPLKTETPLKSLSGLPL